LVTVTAVALAVLTHTLAAGEPLTGPVAVEWFAVQATDENRAQGKMEFGEGLEPVRQAIERFVDRQKLTMDTFVRITHEKVNAPPDKETKLRVDDRYRAFVMPLSRDDRGRIRMTVRIEEVIERDGKESVRDALKTTSSVAANSPLLVGGLKLSKGHLIGAVVVSK
jgi:hypothetical protein